MNQKAGGRVPQPDIFEIEEPQSVKELTSAGVNQQKINNQTRIRMSL